MNSGKVVTATLLVSLLTGGLTVRAAGLQEYVIDSEHSAVIFKVKNRDITFIYGRFKIVSGTISANRRRNPTRIEIKAEVKAQSVDSNSKSRDRHIKGKEFFNTSKFKVISFESKESKKLEDNKFELTGELTLLGKTLPLTVIFEVTGSKSLDRGQYRMGGQTTFTIKRSDFGMDAMIPGIADEVTVIVSLEAERKVAPAG